MKKHTRQTIESPCDIVTDTAILLQSVGVCKINYDKLLTVVHEVCNAQTLVTLAASLFVERNKTGLITLDKLLEAV